MNAVSAPESNQPESGILDFPAGPPRQEAPPSVVFISHMNPRSLGASTLRIGSLLQTLSRGGARVHYIELTRFTPAPHQPSGPTEVQGVVLESYHQVLFAQPPIKVTEPSTLRIAAETVLKEHLPIADILKSVPGPQTILLYGPSPRVVFPLRRTVARHRLARDLRLVIDVPDWLSMIQIPWSKRLVFSFTNSVAMRLAPRYADGLIVISTYLRDFYGKRKPTLLVPPLHHIEEAELPKWELGEEVVVTFTGGGGPNNMLPTWNLVEAARHVRPGRRKLRINILGITAEDAHRHYRAAPFQDQPHVEVVFHGRVPNEVAREMIRSSHFTYLQRIGIRLFNAGFPSKVSESLLCGTPLIANLTSDLKDYLREGVNAVILPGWSGLHLVDALQRLMDAEEGSVRFDRDGIAEEARMRFSPSNYVAPLRDFMDRLHRVPGSLKDSADRSA